MTSQNDCGNCLHFWKALTEAPCAMCDRHFNQWEHPRLSAARIIRNLLDHVVMTDGCANAVAAAREYLGEV